MIVFLTVISDILFAFALTYLLYYNSLSTIDFKTIKFLFKPEMRKHTFKRHYIAILIVNLLILLIIWGMTIKHIIEVMKL